MGCAFNTNDENLVALIVDLFILFIHSLNIHYFLSYEVGIIKKILTWTAFSLERSTRSATFAIISLNGSFYHYTIFLGGAFSIPWVFSLTLLDFLYSLLPRWKDVASVYGSDLDHSHPYFYFTLHQKVATSAQKYVEPIFTLAWYIYPMVL